MEKITTAMFITVTLITVIPNTINLYKTFITKEYDDLFEAGVGSFIAMYFFFIFFALKLGFVIYGLL